VWNAPFPDINRFLTANSAQNSALKLTRGATVEALRKKKKDSVKLRKPSNLRVSPPFNEC
jgi:hypothetical protein